MTIRNNDRGAVMIFVAGTLFVFFGIAALAIDLGLLQDERSDSQNAADLGALRAAWADCNGEADPVAAGVATVALNGYSTAGGDTVTVTNTGTEWTATVVTEIDSTFSGIFGVSELTTTADAIAECQISSGANYAIFAGASACDPTGTFILGFPGSNSTFNGDVHTNQNLEINGSNIDVNGTGTYVGSYSPSGTVNWNPSASNPTDVGAPGVLPYPIDPNIIIDYRPGGSEASAAAALGDYHDFTGTDINTGELDSAGLYNTSTRVIQPGIYYTDQLVDLSDSDITVAGGGGVTFVSDGQIKLSGSDHILRPYDTTYDLLAFSYYIKTEIVPPDAIKDNCEEFGVDMSGSTHDWEGVIFAPRSLVKMAGSSNTTLNGSIIALAVEVSGSDLTLTVLPDAGSGDPSIGLRE